MSTVESIKIEDTLKEFDQETYRKINEVSGNLVPKEIHLYYSATVFDPEDFVPKKYLFIKVKDELIKVGYYNPEIKQDENCLLGNEIAEKNNIDRIISMIKSALEVQ